MDAAGQLLLNQWQALKLPTDGIVQKAEASTPMVSVIFTQGVLCCVLWRQGVPCHAISDYAQHVILAATSYANSDQTLSWDLCELISNMQVIPWFQVQALYHPHCGLMAWR